MEGTVRWFNVQKGYGFVKGDDGDDYFVHYTAIPQGMRLQENDRVTFEAAETERGKQAKNVQLSGQAAPAEESAEEEAPAEESAEEETPAEESAEEETPAEAPAEEETPAEESVEEEKPEEE